jgi:hypothetical protein
MPPLSVARALRMAHSGAAAGYHKQIAGCIDEAPAIPFYSGKSKTRAEFFPIALVVALCVSVSPRVLRVAILQKIPFHRCLVVS